MNHLDDVERAIGDGVNTIKTLTKNGRLLAGAGAVEIELAGRLEDISQQVRGVHRHAIKGYAEALEIVPRSLCENAGGEVDAMLNKMHVKSRMEKRMVGVDVEGLGILDPVEREILDTFLGKKSGLYLATEAALSVLQVDSIVMSKPAGRPKPKDTRQMDED